MENKILKLIEAHYSVLSDLMADIAQYTLEGEYTLKTMFGDITFKVTKPNINCTD